MINIRIKTRFWSIVLFLPIFFIALNCSNYTNRVTNFDSRKDQIRKKYINDPRLSPIKNKKMLFEIDVPDDFNSCLEKWKKYSKNN